MHMRFDFDHGMARYRHNIEEVRKSSRCMGMFDCVCNLPTSNEYEDSPDSCLLLSFGFSIRPRTLQVAFSHYTFHVTFLQW